MYQDSTRLEEFGPCLGRILCSRGISASEFSRLMAYKSRNTIFRILDGTCGNASRQAFYDRLIAEDPLALSDEERAEFARALEVSRVGTAAYLSNKAMAKLVLGGCARKREAIRVYAREYGDGSAPLAQVLGGYMKNEQVKLIITGCCSDSVMEALREALLQQESRCSVSVIHYVYMGPEEAISNISAIQPMLYAPCYQAYSIHPGVYSPQREHIYRNNSICARIRHRDGSEYEEALIQIESDCMIRMERRASGGFMMAGSLLGDANLKNHPIKSDFVLSSVTQGLKEYIGQYRNIEHNRAIYSIKQDLPFNFIHPDVLVEAAKDGFIAGGHVTQAEFDVLLPEIYSIQLDRWENTFAKHRPTYIVFSRRSMEAFVRTGRQSDHYFALSPYTVRARMQILLHIRRQAQDNPNLIVRFLKEDAPSPNLEATLYEGEGVLLAKSFTSYSDDHSEVIIGQSDFCSCFKAYFMEDLMARHVASREESLAILDALIAMAEKL